MNTENQKLIFIRSRFQPFTRFHAELINTFIRRGNQVVLLIIRDYETICRWHDILTNVTNVDLRHLPIFNPLTSWEVHNHVLSNLKKTVDRGSSDLPIIISPLKFSELVGVIYEKGKIIPQDLSKFIEKYPCDEKVYKHCEVMKTLGRIISLIAFDSLPPKFSVVWLFGMFDKEDEFDHKQASKYFIVDKHEFKQDLPKFKLENLSLSLGLYGQFIFWIYLRFLYIYKTDRQYKWIDQWPIVAPDPFNDDEFLDNKSKELQGLLTTYMTDNNEWIIYSGKVGDFLSGLLKKFDKIPSSERDVLLDYSTFINLANETIRAYDD